MVREELDGSIQVAFPFLRGRRRVCSAAADYRRPIFSYPQLGAYFRMSYALRDKHLFGEKQERDGDHRCP